MLSNDFFTLNKNFMMHTSKFYVKKQQRKTEKKTKSKRILIFIWYLLVFFFILYNLVGLCSFLDFLQCTKGILSFFTEKLSFQFKTSNQCLFPLLGKKKVLKIALMQDYSVKKTIYFVSIFFSMKLSCLFY